MNSFKDCATLRIDKRKKKTKVKWYPMDTG